MRRPPLISALVAIDAVILGGLIVAVASGGGGISHAAPDVVICGTRISHSPIGLADLQFWHPASNPSYASTSSPVLVELTRSCKHGGVLSVEPAGSAIVEQRILAADGRIVAVRLRFRERGDVTLRASQGAEDLGRLTVRVT